MSEDSMKVKDLNDLFDEEDQDTSEDDRVGA